MDKNQPASVIRDGNLKATLWSNQSDKGVYVSTTFAKTYEGRDGQVKDTSSFSGTDLLRISELAKKAYALGNRIRREENEAPQSNGKTDAPQKGRVPEHSL